MVLGGSSSRFHGMTFEDNGAARQTEDRDRTRNLTDCGEGVDVSDIALPPFFPIIHHFPPYRKVEKRKIPVDLPGKRRF